MKNIIRSLVVICCLCNIVIAQKTMYNVVYTNGVPSSCLLGNVYIDRSTGFLYTYKLGIGCFLIGSGGANAALSNLASVSINTALLFQTGIDIGSTTKPARDLFLVGSGTFGTNYFRFTGTPTAPRTVTVPDASFTIEQSLTFSAPLSRSTNTISCPTCAITTFMPVFAQVSGSNFTTTSTTPVDITGLSMALTTNAVYYLTCNLDGNGADSNGVNFAVNYSAAGSAIELGAFADVAGTGFRARRMNTVGVATAQSFFTSATDVAATIKGRVTTGANAGNLTIQIQKGVSGTATVYQGSICMILRVS